MVITADLKNALRQRPGRSEGALVRNAPSERNGHAQKSVVPGRAPLWMERGVIARPMWTPAQFRTFRHLVDRAASPRISERAQGLAWLSRFKLKHGSVICDMMLAEIRRLDEIEWLKEQHRTKGA